MFTFVLKDKGTNNQGWWLKLSTVDELCDYIKETSPARYGHVFENYLYGKEWNRNSVAHCPHFEEAALTDAVVRYGNNRNLTILQSIVNFQAMVAEQQMEEIRECGAIYVNRAGGYHGYYKKAKEYAVVKSDKLIFPDYRKNDIKITKFPYGNHYYAKVGSTEVRDGDVIKWNTYEEAYRQEEKYLCSL